MIDINNDLENIKTYLYDGFEDPFPNKELTKFLCGNSKFIRSKLAILYIKSQNKPINHSIYNILAIGEIIHNSSLLHDDVLDEAETRRGNPALSKVYGNKVSILAGDYLLSFAIKNLLKLDNKRVSDAFRNCTQLMCKAEINQFINRGNIQSEEEYLNICKGKTSSLFSAILESCAVILDLDIEKSRKFGELFGMCFQIKNDLAPDSSIQDDKNKIHTALDVLGIEKTNYLLDNYKEEMRKMLSEFPDNVYKNGLEDLISNL